MGENWKHKRKGKEERKSANRLSTETEQKDEVAGEVKLDNPYPHEPHKHLDVERILKNQPRKENLEPTPEKTYPPTQIRTERNPNPQSLQK